MRQAHKEPTNMALAPSCTGCATCDPVTRAADEAAYDLMVAAEAADLLARRAAILAVDPDAQFCGPDCDGDHDAGW